MKTISIERVLLITLWLLLVTILTIYLFFYKELVYHSNLASVLWIAVIAISLPLVVYRYNQGKIKPNWIAIWILVVVVFGVICLGVSKYYFRDKGDKIIQNSLK